MGTPAYMAPEQLLADDGVDARVDVYALMVLTHELVFGRLPTQPPLEGEPRHDELRAAITRGLAADREQRYGTAREAAGALTAALGRDAGSSPAGRAEAAATNGAPVREPGSPPPPSGDPPTVPPGRDGAAEDPGTGGRRRRLAGSLAAITAATAAVIVFLVTTEAWPSLGGGAREPGLPPGVVFEERFSEPGGWPTVVDDNRKYGYADGQYRMIVGGPAKTSKTYAMGVAAPGASGGNIRVEAEASKLTDADAAVGVTCRVGPGLANQSPKYVGVVGTDGSWQLIRIDAGGDERPLAEPAGRARYSTAVRPTGPNTVTLECVGSDAPGHSVVLRLAVNGQRLGEYTDPRGLGAGTVGVAVTTRAAVPVDVRFDNLVATRS